MNIYKNNNVIRVNLNEKFKDSKNRTVMIVPRFRVNQISKVNSDVYITRHGGNEDKMKRNISTDSDKYKNMSTDQKIKVIEAKLKYVINARRVPYRYLTINKLYEILDDLYEEKNAQLSYNTNDNVVDKQENDSGGKSTADVAVVKGKQNINIDIDVRSDEYRKLSDEEKLKVIRGKISKLFKDVNGRVVIVVYNGKKAKISRNKQGEYKDLIEREHKLKEIISKKQEKLNENKNCKNKKTVVSKNVVKCKKVSVKILKVNGIKNVNKGKKNDKINKKSFYDRVIMPFVEKTTEYVNKLKKTCKKEDKNVKKIDNKKSKIKTRLMAGCCAVIIFFTGLTLSKCNKNSNSSVNSIVGGTTQNNTNNTNTEDKENNNSNSNTDTEDKENNNSNNNTNTEDKENNNSNSNADIPVVDEFSISFDDNVTINNNSYIYTNSYDATYGTNAFNPLYGGYHERDVQGLVYSLDGKIYVIYETDMNAVEKQRKLEAAGAVMTAVLVTRNDMTNKGIYEGYYNISSVKVKTR